MSHSKIIQVTANTRG